MGSQRISFSPTGTITDIPDAVVAGQAWNEVSNFVFRKGWAELADKGQSIFEGVTFLAPPVWLLPSVSSFDNFWIYGTDDNVARDFYATDGVTHKKITPVGFLSWPRFQNALTGGFLGGVPIINWQTQSGFWQRDFAAGAPVELLDSPPICEAMRVHNNRVMALNTVNDNGAVFPNTDETVVWASLVDPGTVPLAADWIPAIDNSAGNAQLSGGGPIVDGRSLRSSFVVYLSNRAFIMDEVGGSFVFAIRKLSSTTGAISRNAIAPGLEGHYVFSGDDVYVNDGTTFKSIIDNQRKINLFSQIGDNPQNCICVFYAARSELWLLFPEGAEIYPTSAFVFDVGTRKWGQRDLPRIAFAETGEVPFPTNTPVSWDLQVGDWDDGSFSGNWNRAVLDSRLEGMVLADPNADSLGAATVPGQRFIGMDGLVPGAPDANLYNPQDAFVRVNNLDLGDANIQKTVLGIWPRVTGDNNTNTFTNRLQVTVTGKTRYNATVGAGITKDIRIGQEDRAEMRATGRYFDIRFNEKETTGKFTLEGFDVEFQNRGQF